MNEPTIGAEFARALAAKDGSRMLDLMHPEIDFRGLTPNRNWEATDADAVIATFLGRWFGDSDEIEALEQVEGDAFADRERVGYRFSVRNPDGRFVVVWQQLDGSYMGVFGRRFNAAGQPQGAEFRANTYTTGGQYFPSVAINERGDFSSAEWAHPEIEFVIADGPTAGSWTGLVAMAEGYRDFLSAWEEFRVEAEEFRELDSERVLVLTHGRGRGKTSGLELRQIAGQTADVFYLREGKVTKFVVYFDLQHASADLGLSLGADS